MINAIFFDLGGVLVTSVFRQLEPWLAEQTGSSPKRVKEIRLEYWRDYELGHISGKDFFEKILSDLDATLDPAELVEKGKSFTSVVEDTLDIIKGLRSTGKYRLGVISNNTVEWAAYAGDDLGISDYFDVWITSCDEGIKKPHREIYELAAEKVWIPIEECLFIDDKEDNVEGAIEAGMQGIVFENTKQLKYALKALGIEF